MAGWPKLQQGTNAFQAVALALVYLAALPVLAAPGIDGRCDESSDPAVGVDAVELNSRLVSSTEEALEGHLLEQRIESAARSVFAGDSADDPESLDDADADAPEAEAGGPTASDQQPPPFKRQMYRRDI